MAVLRISKGAASGRRCEVASEQFLIGRAPFCDLRLEERSVSRQHARIVQAADGYYLEDLDSLNGTFLNGRRIQRCRLRDRDRIHVYEVLLEFFDDSSPELKDAPSVSIEPGRHGETSSSQVKLHGLLQMTRNLANASDLDELLSRILDSLFEMLPQAEHGCILLPDGKQGKLAPHAVKDWRGASGFTMGPMCRDEVQRVMASAKALLLTQADDASAVLGEFRTVMCAPVIGPSGQAQGVIHLESSDHRHCFSDRDLELLQSAATIAGQAVEYVQVQQNNVQYYRRQASLSDAKDVQLHLLPQEPPTVLGYDFYHYYQAAEEVGGDFFGYFPLAGERLAIAVGDVVGKGVAAALLMAQLGSEARACLADNLEPAAALTQLNQVLIQRTGGGRMTTFVLAVLDPQKHLVTLANAGHMPPVHRSSEGVATELGADFGGLPLGVEAGEQYQQQTFPLNPGDSVVMYTDGINEAAATSGAFYGMSRVRQIVAEAPSAVDSLAEFLLVDMREFTGGEAQRDDICLVAFGRRSQENA